jgi:hypothetical protein
MATIDLGKIKLVWRGTYSGSTAYTVDDVVQHTDTITSSFICTTASTGNAPSTGGSVHSSWAYLAKGGVAGTDVGTTITTQGDILYRDGSGLQRLAKGTAGQSLKMNSGANAPEWATASSDCVKLAQVLNDNVGAAYVDFQSAFTEATYHSYKLILQFTVATAADPKMRFLDGSNNELTGSGDYKRWGRQAYRKYNDNSGNTEEAWNQAVGNTYFDITGWNQNANGNQIHSIVIDFDLPYPSTSIHKAVRTNAVGYSTSNYGFGSSAGHLYVNSTAVTGFRIYTAENLTKFYATLYGFKK